MTKKKVAAAEGEPLSRYRKIEVRMWGDERFGRLSPIQPSGQGLFLYLLTGPHTGVIPGLCSAGRAQLAEALLWDLEAFDKAFQEVYAEGLAEADWKARVIWIPKAIRYNKPQAPKVVQSWLTPFDLIPECALKWKAFGVLKTSVHAASEPFGKAFDMTFQKALAKASGKPIGKTTGNQEQEQDINSVSKDTGADAPDAIWDEGVAYLVSHGVKESGARSFLGKMRQTLKNDVFVAELLAKAQQQQVSEPLAWLRAAAGRGAHPERSKEGVAL